MLPQLRGVQSHLPALKPELSGEGKPKVVPAGQKGGRERERQLRLSNGSRRDDGRSARVLGFAIRWWVNAVSASGARPELTQMNQDPLILTAWNYGLHWTLLIREREPDGTIHAANYGKVPGAWME